MIEAAGAHTPPSPVTLLITSSPPDPSLTVKKRVTSACCNVQLNIVLDDVLTYRSFQLCMSTCLQQSDVMCIHWFVHTLM